MGRALRIVVTILPLFCVAASMCAAENAALERGTAITDPLALRQLDSPADPKNGLDRAGFGLRSFMPQARTSNAPILNDELFALPSMRPVRRALDEEFDRYVERHRAELPRETIGVGSAFDWQLFDR